MPEKSRLTRREAELLRDHGSNRLMRDMGEAYLRLANRGELVLADESSR